jgi:hypothetical protein
MSSIIGFLEHIGQDEALRHGTADELRLAVERADLDPAFREALLLRDRSRLEELMHCQATICCGLVRPEPGEEDEEEPGKEDEEVRAA